MKMKVFCGIEGGATVSKAFLINEDGDIICSTEGPSTNVWLDGVDVCHQRLYDLIQKAKNAANLNKDLVLDGLGLCMSGCEEDDANRKYEHAFMSKFPNLTKSCTVASDTVGPLYTVSPKGGIVLIAGTGSNSLLINPDATTGRCGGWGHLIGDEASAMWISMRAVKAVFDDEDNLKKSVYDVTKVKELMLQHFEISDKFGILEHCYTNFSKSRFAGLCEKLAFAASNEKDPLCCHLFYEAGEALAKMVIALKPKIHGDLLKCDWGLPIVCVGSVFKSWHLLKNGFIDTIASDYDKFTLMTLNCSSALGAAYLGAKSTGFELPIKHEKNSSILYSHGELDPPEKRKKLRKRPFSDKCNSVKKVRVDEDSASQSVPSLSVSSIPYVPGEDKNDCRCRRKCYSLITEVERKHIFQQFRCMGTKNEQDCYLQSLIAVSEVKQRRRRKSPEESSKPPRDCNYIYTLHSSTGKIVVCKTAFLNIFGVSPDRVRRICLLLAAGEIPVDKRGRCKNVKEKMEDKTEIITPLPDCDSDSIVISPDVYLYVT